MSALIKTISQNDKVIPFVYGPPMVPLIIVHASINEEHPLPFVLDTGYNSALMLDESSAKKLNLQPLNHTTLLSSGIKVKRCLIDNVTLMGEKEESDCHYPLRTAHIGNLRGLDEQTGIPNIAGIVGVGLLTSTVAHLDFLNKRMTLYNEANTQTSSSIQVPLFLKINKLQYFVSTSLTEGLYVDMWVDTGCEITSISKEIAARITPLSIKKSCYWNLSGIHSADELLLARLSIGELCEQEIKVLSKSVGSYSILGLDFLSRFDVTLDFLNGVLSLGKPSDHDQRAHRPGWTGICLKKSMNLFGRARFYVKNLDSHSPAEKAGVRQGDILIEIDRCPTHNLSLPAITRLLNGFAESQAELTIERGGQKNTKIFFDRVGKPL